MNRSSLRRRSALILAAAVSVCAGAADASAPTGRYTIVNGTVSDSKTGLTWQQNISLTKYPSKSDPGNTSAASYCAFLGLNGTQAWRVPTIKELLTIVDVRQKSPAIDPNAFPSTPADFFLTVNSNSFQPGIVWTVNFDTGLPDGATVPAVQDTYVRCVR